MSIRVFLADDHAVVRDGLRMLLEAHPDIEVVGDAADGRETVRQVKVLRPHVLVMDIAMPELNGIEATAQVREVSPATRVIILSMHSDSEHVYRALKAGASGYLLKECAGLEVVKAVRAVWRGRRYLSSGILEHVLQVYLSLESPPEGPSPLESLSAREREVLQLLAEGKSNKEVAVRLSLSVSSVETYRGRAMRKLGLSDTTGLVKFAIQHGLVPLP